MDDFPTPRNPVNTTMRHSSSAAPPFSTFQTQLGGSAFPFPV